MITEKSFIELTQPLKRTSAENPVVYASMDNVVDEHKSAHAQVKYHKLKGPLQVERH